MEISQDYLFKIIGVQTVKVFALEDANAQLVKEKDELQKALKQSTEKEK